MQKLLVANWKENPSSEKKALSLFREVAKVKRGNVQVIICPPFVYLEGIADMARKMPVGTKKGFALGAQDIFWEDQGAYTSEVGAKMIKGLGARYVIVGHSERRRYAKETDAMINRKVQSALHAGLHVILCVGESLSVRKKGLSAARAFIKNQLKKDLKGSASGHLTIAYEPIWAIGTGKNDKPEDAVEMARFIKQAVSGGETSVMPRFLYGGSVNSKNIADYVQYKEIDGALVGGASLKSGEFKKMIEKIYG